MHWRCAACSARHSSESAVRPGKPEIAQARSDFAISISLTKTVVSMKNLPMRITYALFAAASTALGAQQPRADLILVNGRVLTVDSGDRVAQAVAVAGNKIVAVGTTADIERTAGLGTRRIDLHGRAVTPGLLDAHAHFSGGAADRLYV